MEHKEEMLNGGEATEQLLELLAKYKTWQFGLAMMVVNAGGALT